MARKNRRMKTEYRRGLGFNPRKYLSITKSSYPQKITDHTPQRGDIWFADLGSHSNSSVQSGCRPVIVISNNIGNAHADTVNIVPMTRHLKKPELPCHTEITPDNISDKRQFLETSMVLAEQVTTISKLALRNYAGHIEEIEVMQRIDDAVAAQLGIIVKEELKCL